MEKRFTPEFGQFMVATRNLSAGELLLEEPPIASVLNEKHKLSHCASCFEPGNLRCTACNKIQYCDKKCQKYDWKVHKFECKVLQKATRNLNMTMRYVIRLLIQIHLNPSLAGGLNSPLTEKAKFNGIGSLVSHIEKFDREKLDHYTLLAKGLSLLLEDKFLLSVNDIITLFCISTCNSMTISDENEAIGGGLYAKLCMVNHSCKINASISFSANIGILTTACDIKKGEQIFISYSDHFLCKQERQKIMRETYYFRCRCEWCVSEDPMDLIVCLNCQKYTLQSRFECKYCKTKLTKVPDDDSLAIMQLAPSHHRMPKILSELEERYLSNENWAGALSIYKRQCEAYQLSYGTFTYQYGILLFKISKCAQLIPTYSSYKTAVVAAEEACKVFGTACGKSSVYRAAVENLRMLRMTELREQ